MPEADLAKVFEGKPDKTLDYGRMLCEARFSPCGKFLLGAGYDAALPRWEVAGEEFKPLSPLEGHHGWVQGFDFHPRGEMLFSGDSWGKVNCWRYADAQGRPVWTRDNALTGWIRALAVSRDGTLLAVAGNDRAVKLLSAADGTLQREMPHDAPVFSLCFHPDGKSLVTGDWKGKLRHFDYASGKLQRELDAGLLYKLDRIQECGGARKLAFDTAGDRLVVGGQKNPGGGFATGTPCAVVFDWNTGQVAQEMPIGANDDGFIYDVWFLETGCLIGTSCAFPGKGHVWLWKPGEPKPLYQGNKLPNGRSLSLHPDRRRLAYTTCVSANGNGRNLDGGTYKGGNTKIHILQLPA